MIKKPNYNPGREYIGYNKKIPYLHHLESYYAIMQNKTNIIKWSIFKDKNAK